MRNNSITSHRISDQVEFTLYTVEEEHAIQTNLFPLDSIQETYISSNSKETSLQTYTHIFNLEVKKVEILIDLNWKWGIESIQPL